MLEDRYWGAVSLGEHLSPWLLAGAALVVCGIYLVNRRSAQEEKAG